MAGLEDALIPEATDIPPENVMARMFMDLRRLREAQDLKMSGFVAVQRAVADQAKEYMEQSSPEIEQLTTRIASLVKGGARSSFPTLGNIQKKRHLVYEVDVDVAGPALAALGFAEQETKWAIDVKYKGLDFNKATGSLVAPDGEVVPGIKVEDKPLWHFMPEKNQAPDETTALETAAAPKVKKERKAKVTPEPPSAIAEPNEPEDSAEEW